MRRTRIILGPPGTGKTTYLLNTVESEIQSGVAPDRIAYVSFTRKAANEARDRAIERFGFSVEDLPWFRTLHSIAFQLLRCRRNSVMNNEHFQDFGRRVGLAFEGDYSPDDSAWMPRFLDGLGDRMMTISALCRVSRKQVNDVMIQHHLQMVDRKVACPSRTSAEQYLEWFDDALREYKQTYQLIDFADMLDYCHTAVPVDVAIIDEAQDLTAQQWDVARRMFRDAERVYIAGDDDQAIFEWSGADVNQFIRLKGETVTLDRSYRVPSELKDIAERVASRISFRRTKQWSPVKIGGSVSGSRDISDVDFGNGQWLALARNRKYLRKIEQVVRDQGIPYILDGKSSMQRGAVLAAISYERLRQGRSINSAEFLEIIKRQHGVSLKPTDSPNNIRWDDVNWPFEGNPSWLDLYTSGKFHIPDRDATYIRDIKRRGEKLSGTPRVTISTIHGAKGGESDNVALYTGMARQTRAASLKIPDPEFRVWYVAVTRSRRELHVVSGGKNGFAI